MSWTKASIDDVKRSSPVADIVGADAELKPEGDDLVGCCTLPGHKDDTPSLRVNPKKNVWRCHGCNAGGSPVDWLMQRHGLPFRDAMTQLSERSGVALVDDGKGPTGKRRLVASYDYCDGAGQTIYTIERYEPGKQGRSKDILQKMADGTYGKSPLQVLYRLPEVMTAVATQQPVFVCEGEKAANALAELGVCSTTHAGGASATKTWKAVGFIDPLKGADVVLLPDNDDPGRKLMQEVARVVGRVAKSVTFVQLPVTGDGDDAVEWIRDGGDLSKLRDLVAEARAQQEEDDNGWKTMIRMGKERPLGSPGNLELIVENDPALRGLFAYDEFASRVVLTKAPPWRERVISYPRPLVDADVTRLAVYVEAAYDADFGTTVIGAVIASVADRSAFNPLTSWLRSLVWDGKPRLSRWLHRYAGADDNPYTQAVARAWAISTVARALKPGCKVDTTLVLEGSQGRGKSSLLRALVGSEWFMDHLPDFSSKDAAILVGKAWVHELSELATLSRSEVEKIKQFLSQQADVYRAPYAANTVDVPRKCVFAATTNRSDYLRDTTGNRRFWPVKTGNIDIQAAMSDRGQLWAEAVAAFDAGEGWHITDREVLALAEEEQAQRLEHDPWMEDIRKFVESQESVLMSDVLKQIGVEVQKRSPRDGERVGGVLRALGWAEMRERTTSGRVRVWRRVKNDRTDGPPSGPPSGQLQASHGEAHQKAVSEAGTLGPLTEPKRLGQGEKSSAAADGDSPSPQKMFLGSKLSLPVHTLFTHSEPHQEAISGGPCGPGSPSVHKRPTSVPATDHVDDDDDWGGW